MNTIFQRIERIVFIIVGALIVSGCLLSVVYIYDDSTGQISSSLKGQAATGQLSVQFPEQLLEKVEQTVQPQSLEMGWCLYGSFSGTAYRIRDVVIPESLVRRRNHARFGCEQNLAYLGTMHSHPKGEAYLSKGDLKILSEDYITIMGIYTADSPVRINFFHTRDQMCFATVYVVSATVREECNGT